jgi:ribose transport system substrate-binding protein
MTAGALRVGVFAALWLIASGVIASARELKSIGVSLPDLEIPFFSEVNRGITNAAKRIGAEVTPVSNHNDVGQQTQQIQAFVDNKIDLIILYPDDEKALSPVVKQARARGVFVVAVGGLWVLRMPMPGQTASRRLAWRATILLNSSDRPAML